MLRLRLRRGREGLTSGLCTWILKWRRTTAGNGRTAAAGRQREEEEKKKGKRGKREERVSSTRRAEEARETVNILSARETGTMTETPRPLGLGRTPR